MDQQQIKALIDALTASDLSELEYNHDGVTLRLVKQSALTVTSRNQGASNAMRFPALTATSSPAPVSTSPATTASALVPSAGLPKELAAPLYGVVHLQRSPDEAPFVAVGQAFKAGETMCVIEAMKVFNEVRSEHDGTVEAVLVSSGQEVEAGQPLFLFGNMDGSMAKGAHV